MTDIIKSKLRAKILEYYFNQPDLEIYLRELARSIKEDPANLCREMDRLVDEDIFVYRVSGKQKYFKLNKDYIFYKELKSIVARSLGIESKLVKALISTKGITASFIYGSYADGREKAGSDIDLFIIGNKSEQDEFIEKINSLEKRFGREINYRFFSINDFAKSIKEKNSFIINILKNKKIFLIGNEKDIGKFY
jgi:predicted nucleotidyltransferase/predicted transcriptional regulator with HTH domain